MSWFSKKTQKDREIDYSKINNPNDLFAHLIHREHWKGINPDILKQIFKNSQSSIFAHPNEGIEVIKHFIFISERYDLVKNNYIQIAKDALCGDVLGEFSTTLYFLGSNLEDVPVVVEN